MYTGRRAILIRVAQWRMSVVGAVATILHLNSSGSIWVIEASTVERMVFVKVETEMLDIVRS
jgi:hypothetical protein